MTIYDIREVIAESGKMTVKDCVNYFKRRFPNAPASDIAICKEQAKEMIREAKQFNNL